ncbi:toxin-antitoxin system protein [Allofournierella sp.]|uniref:toxin-antitoxin system protein n=1 Tax=Allofournierella sp. TaxID=1940256 RepID=UPI003AB4063D
MKPAKEKPLKEKVSITLDTDIIKIFQRLSVEDDRSLSSTINLVLRKYLRENNLQDET